MWIVTLALVAAVVRLPDPAVSAGSRVRPVDPAACALVADGIARSPTLAAIVSELDRRNLVVFVETFPGEPGHSSLQVLTRAASTTYAHVRVDPALPFDARVAALAHQLARALVMARGQPAR